MSKDRNTELHRWLHMHISETYAKTYVNHSPSNEWSHCRLAFAYFMLLKYEDQPNKAALKYNWLQHKKRGML